MIYTIGFNSKNFRYSSVDDAVEYLELCKVVGLDIETTRKFKGVYGDIEGLCPYVSDIVMIQIGDLSKQFILDARKLPIEDIKRILNSVNDRRTPIVGQNLKFEWKHIYHNYGIELTNLIDTQIAEAIITNGLPQSLSLKYLTKKYLRFDFEKDIRMSFLNLGDKEFNEHQIQYGADDITIPLRIIDMQTEILKETNQDKCFKLEMNFLEVLSMMEYTGFNIDVNKWKEVIVHNNKLFKEQEIKLNNLLIEHLPKESVFSNSQLDMFSEDIKVNVNLSSPTQCIQMLKELGIDCVVVDKKKGIEKNTLEAKALKSYLILNKNVLNPNSVEVLKEFIRYKELEQSCSTFGQKFLDENIHPITGRLHSNFRQTVSTGRMSSSKPNIQNIPKDIIYRRCFVSSNDGNLVIADYSGQENYVLVNQSLDPDLLAFYEGEENDMHSYIASKIYKKLEGLKLSEIKERYPELRENAKGAGFAISYGGNGFTISSNLGIPEAEGKFLYDSYFKAFPGLRNYYDRLMEKSLALGYILIDPITGRRRNFIKPTNRKEEGEIRRQCLNSPVQGTSGSMTKLAMIILSRELKKHNLQDLVKITNVIHDEIILETFTKDKTILEISAKVLENSMVTAASVFCKTVPLKADAIITDYWKH